MFRKYFYLAIIFFAGLSHAQELVDPTRPKDSRRVETATGTDKASGPAGLAAFQLSAIFKRKEKALVIINGKTLGKGDSIQGAIVAEIGLDSVTLNVEDESKTLYLMKQTKDIKTDVSNQF